MKSSLATLIIVTSLAACSSSPGGHSSQATASVSEPSGITYSEFTESDLAAMRPETQQSRQVLLRLKGPRAKHQARGR